jgi:hypothetical protein
MQLPLEVWVQGCRATTVVDAVAASMVVSAGVPRPTTARTKAATDVLVRIMFSPRALAAYRTEREQDAGPIDLRTVLLASLARSSYPGLPAGRAGFVGVDLIGSGKP